MHSGQASDVSFSHESRYFYGKQRWASSIVILSLISLNIYKKKLFGSAEKAKKQMIFLNGIKIQLRRDASNFPPI